MNTLHIAGHLGADPEVRYTPNGNKVTSLRVAAKTRKKGQDDTIWYRITVWGDQFDKMIAHLKKGSAVIVIGDLQKPEVYTAKDGSSQVSIDVTAHHLMFSPFGKTERSFDGAPAQTQAQSVPVAAAAVAAPVQGTAPVSDALDDDLPF